MKMPVFLGKRLLSVLSLFMIMMLFQNCGLSEEGVDLSEYEEQRANSLPFAFDLSIDHIAYMSCEGENLGLAQGAFNFKAGAYGDGEGIKFKESFKSSSQVGALFSNKDKLIDYLAASENNRGTGVVMSIRESGDLRGPFSVGSLKQEDALTPMIWDQGGNVTLTQPQIASALYENPQGINYLKGFPGLTGKAFEGELSFEDLGAQNFVRATLSGAGYLAFTFATEDLEAPGVLARSPHDPTGKGATEETKQAKTSVFGKGYKMNFSQFDPGRTSSPRVVVSSVTGVELQNDNVTLGENWICPPNERYVIVKDKTDAMRRYDGALPTVDHDNDALTAEVPNDPWESYYDDGGQSRGGYYVEYLKVDRYDEDGDGNDTESVRLKHKVLCPMIPDEMSIGQAEHNDQAWKRIRNILSPDEWYVYRGTRYNCIVPKKDNGTACYGKTAQSSGSNQIVLQYFASEDFVEQKLEDEKVFQEDTSKPKPIRPVVTDCEATSGDAAGRACPHILSVCYKQ